MPIKTYTDAFQLTAKRILKTHLSNNQDKLNEYRTDIVKAYNKIVDYVSRKYDSYNSKQKEEAYTIIQACKDKLESCFARLECSYSIDENLLVNVDIEKIGPPKCVRREDAEEESDSDQAQETDLNTTLLDLEKPALQQPSTSGEKPKVVAKKNNNIEEIMENMSNAQFLKMASGHLSKYSGDPLSLQSFIDSVKLLESLATNNDLKAFLVALVRTKIDGRARELISDDDNTVEAILTKLRSSIKPDNSKVVEGRMLAIRLNMNSSSEFAQKVEELSDAYRRALVIEGISHAKANEMAVDKTIDLCRANARSDLVKSVLEASRFEQPKDVVAKLLTQIGKVQHEHQVLSYTRNSNQRGQRGRGGNQNNRGQGHSQYQYSQHQYSNQNNGNSGYRGYGRGRGRGRGGQGRGRYNSYHNSGQNQQNGQNGAPSVRAFANQGNNGEQQQSLGFHQSQNNAQ